MVTVIAYAVTALPPVGPAPIATSTPTASSTPTPGPTATDAPRVAPVIARIPFAHSDAQTAFDYQTAVTDGAIWVADARGFYLVRVDIATNRVNSTVPIEPSALFTGDGALWTLSPVDVIPGPDRITISRVDLLTGAVRAVGSRPYGSAGAAGLGALWLIIDHLEKIDPKTLEVRATFSALGTVIQVACGALWAWQDVGPGLVTLDQLDPETGQVMMKLGMGDDAQSGGLHEADGSCWTQSAGMLLRIQRGSGMVARVPAGTYGRVQVAGDTFWTWDSDGTIQQLDPATGKNVGPVCQVPGEDTFTNPKGGPDWRLLSAGGSLWLLNGAEVVRFDISTRVAGH